MPRTALVLWLLDELRGQVQSTGSTPSCKKLFVLEQEMLKQDRWCYPESRTAADTVRKTFWRSVGDNLPLGAGIHKGKGAAAQ